MADINDRLDRIERSLAAINRRLPQIATVEQMATLGKTVDTNTHTLFAFRDIMVDFRKTLTDNTKYLEGRVIGQTSKIDQILRFHDLPVTANYRLPGSDFVVPSDIAPDVSCMLYGLSDSDDYSGTSSVDSMLDEEEECLKSPPPAPKKPRRNPLARSQIIDLSQIQFSPENVDHEALKKAFIPKKKVSK